MLRKLALLITPLLILALVLGCIGCGDDDETETANTQTPVTTGDDTTQPSPDETETGTSDPTPVDDNCTQHGDCLPPFSDIAVNYPADEWTSYHMQITDGTWIVWAVQMDLLLVRPPLYWHAHPPTFELLLSNESYVEEETGAVYHEVKVPKEGYCWPEDENLDRVADDFYYYNYGLGKPSYRIASEYSLTEAGWIHAYLWLAEDGEGRYYPEGGGDVDVSTHYYEPTDTPQSDVKTDPRPEMIFDFQRGDGTPDEPGSMWISMKIHLSAYITSGPGALVDGALFQIMEPTFVWTTGSSTASADETMVGKHAGMSFPDPIINGEPWDKIVLVDNKWRSHAENPDEVHEFESGPLDENLGGTLAGTSGTFNEWFAWGAGALDVMFESYFIMQQVPAEQQPVPPAQ